MKRAPHPALATTAALATTVESLAFAAGVAAAEMRAAAERGEADLARGLSRELERHLRRALALAEGADLTCELAQTGFDPEGGAR